MGTTENPQAWSLTAADNDDADAGINWLEGQDPGTVNGSARGMMGALKAYILDVGGGVSAVGGTANAITITTNQVISSAHEAAGFSLRFKAASTNTAAVTVAVDGLTAQAVERMDGTALQAGDILANGIYDIAYNATNGGYTLLSTHERKTTFTPALSFGGATTGITYSTQIGRYVKQGSLVLVRILLILTSKGTATGDALITALPFTSESTIGTAVTVRVTLMASTVGDTYISGLVPENGTTIALYKQTTGSAVQLTDADFGNTSALRLAATYEV